MAEPRNRIPHWGQGGGINGGLRLDILPLSPGYVVPPKVTHDRLRAAPPFVLPLRQRYSLAVVVDKAPIRVLLMGVRLSPKHKHVVSIERDLVAHDVSDAQAEAAICTALIRAVHVVQTPLGHHAAVVAPELARAEEKVLVEVLCRPIEASEVCQAVAAALWPLVAQVLPGVFLEVPGPEKDSGVEVPQRRRERNCATVVALDAIVVLDGLLLWKRPLPPRSSRHLRGHQPPEDRPRALRDVEVTQQPGLRAGNLHQQVLPPNEVGPQLVLGHARVVVQGLVEPEAALHPDPRLDAHGDAGDHGVGVLGVPLPEPQDLYGDVEPVGVVADSSTISVKLEPDALRRLEGHIRVLDVTPPRDVDVVERHVIGLVQRRVAWGHAHRRPEGIALQLRVVRDGGGDKRRGEVLLVHSWVRGNDAPAMPRIRAAEVPVRAGAADARGTQRHAGPASGSAAHGHVPETPGADDDGIRSLDLQVGGVDSFQAGRQT
eukprot:CAMPEP_0175631892 /NCGR_PEP_ID=MMETSP0096-20121207/73743_1 /TAXON_ID=311494 /ORGANISM="Alexandrium monilatum, Strain CCMP3105" /LENGTH=487 /DNA_ID=CAMNT_0016937323 /DNA_START=187 /DNA_END=1647 /DNA_ORIENTATION=-